jgi:hypothetical protein
VRAAGVPRQSGQLLGLRTLTRRRTPRLINIAGNASIVCARINHP